MNNLKKEIKEKKQLLDATLNVLGYIETIIENKDKDIQGYKERINNTDDDYDKEYYSEAAEDAQLYIEACGKIIGALNKLV